MVGRMRNGLLVPAVKRDSSLMKAVLEDRRSIITAVLDIMERYGCDEARKRLIFALKALEGMLEDLEEEDLIIKIIRKG